MSASSTSAASLTPGCASRAAARSRSSTVVLILVRAMPYLYHNYGIQRIFRHAEAIPRRGGGLGNVWFAHFVERTDPHRGLGDIEQFGSFEWSRVD